MGYNILAISRNGFSLNLTNAGLILAVLSTLTVGGALGIEHIGGIPPCPLCLEQRIAYYAAIPLGMAAFAFASGHPVMTRMLLVIMAIGFLINSGLGVYHSGIEWGWWPGPEACSGSIPPLANNPADLLDSLNQPRVVRCDEAPLRIFGISLAGYSALTSLFYAALALLPMFQKQ